MVGDAEAEAIFGRAVGAMESRAHRARARLLDNLDGEPRHDIGNRGVVVALRSSE